MSDLIFVNRIAQNTLQCEYEKSNYAPKSQGVKSNRSRKVGYTFPKERQFTNQDITVKGLYLSV